MSARPVAARISTFRHESAAACYSFSELIPHAALRGLVRQIWHVRGGTAYQREKMLPDGDVVLLFNLGPAQGLVDRNDRHSVRHFGGAWVSGFQQRYLVLETLGESHLIGVRLDPLGAYALLGLPMSELTDRVIDLDLVLGAAVWGWHRMLLEAPSLQRRFELIEALLLDWYRHRRPWHPATEYLRRQLVAHGGVLALGPQCRKIGLSAKTLNRRFIQQVGVSPKRFARLQRFRRAVELIDRAPDLRLAELAVEVGYFDQPHFNREFRHFAGVSPTVYWRDRSPDGGSVVE